jgi:putative transposase
MAYRYRVYPTLEQLRLFLRTVGCARFVYNRAVRLFKDALAAKELPPSYARLCAMLTAWKDEFPWLRDVPHHCLQQSLKDARQALDRFFAGEAKFPKFHKKGQKESFRFPDAGQFRCGTLSVDLPKAGAVPWIVHRPLEGTPKSVTVSMDGGHWYASAMCELEGDYPTPVTAETIVSERVRAADLGVARPITDSDGAVYALPQITPRQTERQRRLQQNLARKKKGSANRRRAVQALNRFQAKLRRRRLDARRKAVVRLFGGADVLAFENLNVKGMTASAAGTVDAPGVNVAQKAGLNRSILDVGWGNVVADAKTYARRVGKRVAHPKHAYSSQECAACGHVSAENRPDQATFHCVACGNQDNADDNAAKVLKKRTLENLVPLVGAWDAEQAELRAKAEAAMARREKTRAALAAKRDQKKRQASEGPSAPGCGDLCVGMSMNQQLPQRTPTSGEIHASAT